MDLIQLTHRSLLPLNVDYILVAELSESLQFSLYILQRMYIQDPKNRKVMELLMNISIKMDRIPIVRSLFNKAESEMNKFEIANLHPPLHTSMTTIDPKFVSKYII